MGASDIMARLSGTLAPLATLGSRIVDGGTGTPVRLVGVNRSGLEYVDPGPGGLAFLDAASMSADEMDAITGVWQARIIRLPFNQDFVFNGRRGLPAEDYLAAIDQMIAWAAARGAYTLLDLQWLDATRVFGTNGDMSFNRVPALPEPPTLDLWDLLATRYRDEPAVLFDLFNEPHSPMADDANPLYVIGPNGDPFLTNARTVSMREWQPWARRLIDVIRALHPGALIFVAGIAWAYDLRGMPLTDALDVPLANIVYSTHVYPWTRISPLPFGSWETEWTRAFGHLTGRVPVFAGEWGGTLDDVAWGQRLARYFATHDIGWTAWSWADWPQLVTSYRTRDYTPTPFGDVVRQSLLPEMLTTINVVRSTRDRSETAGRSTPAGT
jgi:endoglucanase